VYLSVFASTPGLREGLVSLLSTLKIAARKIHGNLLKMRRIL
jgi:hypothetical protein